MPGIAGVLGTLGDVRSKGLRLSSGAGVLRHITVRGPQGRLLAARGRGWHRRTGGRFRLGEGGTTRGIDGKIDLAVRTDHDECERHSGGSTLVPMVEAADLGDLHDVVTHAGRLDRPPLRRIPAQRPVSPGLVVVCKVRVDDPGAQAVQAPLSRRTIAARMSEYGITSPTASHTQPLSLVLQIGTAPGPARRNFRHVWVVDASRPA